MMKIDSHAITEGDIIARFTQQVIERSIDGGDFGNNANRAPH
jgi:hypothetical protein